MSSKITADEVSEMLEKLIEANNDFKVNYSWRKSSKLHWMQSVPDIGHKQSPISAENLRLLKFD